MEFVDDERSRAVHAGCVRRCVSCVPVPAQLKTLRRQFVRWSTWTDSTSVNAAFHLENSWNSRQFKTVEETCFFSKRKSCSPGSRTFLHFLSTCSPLLHSLPSPSVTRSFPPPGFPFLFPLLISGFPLFLKHFFAWHPPLSPPGARSFSHTPASPGSRSCTGDPAHQLFPLTLFCGIS